MILMDEDFGYDDVIGNQTVELDDLPMNKEIKQLVKFSEVRTRTTHNLHRSF